MEWEKDIVSLTSWNMKKAMIGLWILPVERPAVGETEPYGWSYPWRHPLIQDESSGSKSEMVKWRPTGKIPPQGKVGSKSHNGKGIFLIFLTGQKRCWHFFHGLKSQKKLLHLPQLNHQPILLILLSTIMAIVGVRKTPERHSTNRSLLTRTD